MPRVHTINGPLGQDKKPNWLFLGGLGLVAVVSGALLSRAIKKGELFG